MTDYSWGLRAVFNFIDNHGVISYIIIFFTFSLVAMMFAIAKLWIRGARKSDEHHRSIDGLRDKIDQDRVSCHKEISDLKLQQKDEISKILEAHREERLSFHDTMKQVMEFAPQADEAMMQRLFDFIENKVINSRVNDGDR